jgi:predicted alpha/beta-fold hydrolase
VFHLNLRDHGDTHHLNKELFHSCRIDEVIGAVQRIVQTFDNRPLVIGGFSLGGNFALRVALRAPSAGIPLTWAFAICPVISPRAGLASIEDAPWIYEYYFMLKWRASLRRKQELFPQQELFSKRELRGNMRDLTAGLVSRHTNFGTLDNYLDGYSIAGDTLAGLRVPASILTAADDPVIPIAAFRQLKLAPTTDLTIVPHGGHCGFIADWSLRSWAEDFVMERLNRALGEIDVPEIGAVASGAA